MQSFKYAVSHSDGVSSRGHVAPADTRVFRNDWSALTPPSPGTWTPTLTVSVLIPARGGQDRLDLTLATLARQSYPARLTEVVVVDDHSGVPLRLPDIRPARCRIERAPVSGWGAGHARAYGAHVTSGQVICWLDPDLVAGPRLIETLVRWQHAHPEAVTLGHVRVATDHPITPAEAARRTESAEFDALFADACAHPWVEHVLEHSGDLRDADHLGFHAFVGSCAALRRTLYEAVGGVDSALTLGHDTELGYRLWQAGGVFVPDRQARAWHLGPATLNRTRVPSTRFRSGVLADLMPHPRTHRQTGTAPAPSTRRVPLVRAVVDVTATRYELVRACVDRLLACSEQDLEVTLVTDWDAADDFGLEARLIQANYLAEPRVSFAATAPRTGFPSPYLLDVPVWVGVQPQTVEWLVARAERARAGVTELTGADGSGPGLVLWRTRAVARALRGRGPDEELVQAVTRIHGRYRVRGAGTEYTDLSAPQPQCRPRPSVPAPRREGVPGPVPAPRVRGPLRRLGSALIRPLRALRRGTR